MINPFMRLVLIIFLLSVTQAVPCFSQHESRPVVLKDLKADWMIFRDNGYRPYDGGRSKTIYFTLPPSTFRGDLISIRSEEVLDIFINGQLAIGKPTRKIVFSIDSLRKRNSQSLTFGLHQKNGIGWLVTEVQRANGAQDANVQEPVKGRPFLNFSILAVLILAGFFVFLFRSNPKLTLDYLNFTRLVSVQEREDNLMSTRITASVNLLFYLLVSASCALALLAIFYFGADRISVAQSFPIQSTAEGFYQWFRLIVILAVLLGAKLLIIFGFSILFRLRDTARLQFFNFIRMLFFITGIIIVVALAYFMWYGYPVGPDTGLLKMILVLLTFSAVMSFLKLLSLTSFRFFHLFSYLCASEFIPLVILVRVLLY